MQRSDKKHALNPTIYVESFFPQSSLIDFELLLKALEKEFANEDEGFHIIKPYVQLSETAYEIKLKNGTTIKCKQEETSDGLRLKQDVYLGKINNSHANEDGFSKQDAILAANTMMATHKATQKPEEESEPMQVFIKITPENPTLLKMLQQAFKDKGCIILDNPPEERQLPSFRR